MLEDIEIELLLKKKEFSRNLFLSMSLLFLFYFALTSGVKEYSILLKNNRKFYLIGFLSCGYMGYLISKLEYDFVQMYKILMLFMIIIVIYLCLTHCHFSYSVYSYYIPVTLFILLLTKKEVAIIFGLFFLVLCFFTRSIAEQYGFSSPKIIAPEMKSMITFMNTLTLLNSAYFSLFLIYYYTKFKKIEIRYFEVKGSNEIFKSDENILTDKKNEESKFDALYLEIINLLQNNKNYQNPNFSKTILADLLNTNESYITKAITGNGNKNFNKLINQFRINQVLEEFNTKSLTKKTIEQIYTEAGFTQQSTFNRVFKDFTGYNPSDYIEANKE